MYFNNIAASRPDAGDDSFLQLLNPPSTGMRFGLPWDSNNMNQHHSDRTQTNMHAKHLRSTAYPQPPQMTILPQWAPYIYPEEDQLSDGDDANDAVAVAVNTNGDDQNHSKTSAGQNAQNLNEPLLSPSSSPPPSSSHFNQQLPPPGWTSVHLFGKSHHVAPPAALYTDPKSLSIQIIKSTLDPNFIPFDPLSTQTQDSLKLGQSQLVPQGTMIPSHHEVENVTGDFVAEQQRVLRELGAGVLGQNYTGSGNGSDMNGEMGYNPLFVTKMSKNPTALASQPMITAPIPVVFEQDGVYHQHAVMNSNNNSNNNNPDKLLSSPSPTMTKLKSALVTATVVASKLPKKGFLYSDDTLIRSYLPHHTHGHDKASLIHQLPPQHDSSSSYYNNTNHSSYDSHHHSSSTATTITTSRYQHSISSRPITQQNLPDMITGFTDNIIPGGSMNTQTPLVTPVNLISSDAYRQLSLPTHHFNTKLEKRMVGCCHRTKLPSFLSFLFSALTDVQLDTPAVRPNRHFHAYQQGIVNLIYNYRSELTPGNPNKDNKNDKKKKKFPGLAQKLSQISPTLPHLITKHLISALKESFSTSITIQRMKPEPPLSQARDRQGILTSSANGLNPTNLQLNPYIIPSQNTTDGMFKDWMDVLWDTTYDSSREQHYTSHLSVNPINSGPQSQNPYQKYTNDLKMYYIQPDIPLFGENHVHQFLFSPENNKIKIWPFSTTSSQFFPKLSAFFQEPSPSISLAQLFSSCFRCLRTPANIIQRYNNRIDSYWDPFELKIYDYFQKMYKFAGISSTLSSQILNDISLHSGIPENFTPRRTRDPREVGLVCELMRSFEFIYLTPLFYKIKPKTMFDLIYTLNVGTRSSISWVSPDYRPVHYSIKDYDGYGLLTALIRWGVYWESVKYVSHISNCPILKKLKKIYTSIVKHSLAKFELKQHKYLEELNIWVDDYYQRSGGQINNDGGGDDHDHATRSSSHKIMNDHSTAAASSSHKIRNKTTEPFSPLSQSSTSLSSLSVPLPPQFTFEIPPEIQHKYSNFSTFLNSTNACEICNTYRDVRIVHKPWAQPLQSTPFNHTSPQYRHHATQPLPTTVFDLNLFNLPLFDGFSNTGGLDTHVQPQSQSQSQSPKSPSTPSTCTSFPHLHNHSLRYDMASGKLHELMGQALSISPETLAQLNLPIETWETILNPNQHKKTSVHADNLTFAAIYHADRGEFEPVDTINNKNHGYYKGSGGGNQNNTQNATPTPHQEHKRLSSTILHHQPLSDAYGIYIPTHLVRKQLSPMLTMFATMTFTSSQLASLFQPPSIFTEYEQFFILMSREMGAIGGEKPLVPSYELSSSRKHPILAQVPVTGQDSSSGNNNSSTTTTNLIWMEKTSSSTQPQVESLESPYTQTSNSRLGLSAWNWDHGMRYECQLIDLEGASNQKLKFIAEYEREKGLAQTRLNPNFTPKSTSQYFSAVNEVLYERYHYRQCSSNSGDGSGSHPKTVADGANENGGDSDKKMKKMLDQDGQNENEPFFFLNSTLLRYKNILKSRITSEPGYRDGIYLPEYRLATDTVEKTLDPNGRDMLYKLSSGLPVDFSVLQHPKNNLPKSSRVFDKSVQQSISRNVNYTMSFPKTRFIESTGSRSENDLAFSGWIQSEYLLSTQKFTKIAVLNDILMYPYLEMKGSCISNAMSSGGGNGSGSGGGVSVGSGSLGLGNQKDKGNEGNLSGSNDNSDNKTISFLHQLHYQTHQQLSNPQKQQEYQPSINTLQQSHQPNKPTATTSLYYSPTTTVTPLATDIIYGITPSARQQGKFPLISRNNYTSLHFAKAYENYTCAPDMVICWNWYIAPTLMTLIAVVLFVLFGLVYQKKLEPTPSSLILMPIFAGFITLFPFLFYCQKQCELAPKRNKICGISKCCGISAYKIRPSTNRFADSRMIETVFLYTTFGEDYESSPTPSISRFFSAFFIAWLLISTYTTWTGLYVFSLVAIFVPCYVLLGGAILTFWHRVGVLGLTEAIPSLSLLISLGVLHGALADPDNHKYNALAVGAPFLFWIGLTVIAGLIASVAALCDFDDDDCCNDPTLFFIWTLMFLSGAIIVLYFVFLLFILQHIIRPNVTGWYIPPFWAAHFLTYPIIIMIFIMLWIPSDENRELPNNERRVVHPLDSHEVASVDNPIFLNIDQMRV